MTYAGVYIHIPFCRSRCSYCDFATGMYESATAERYVRALITEISAGAGGLQKPAIDTIYFGGGTPSLLSAGQIEDILHVVHQTFAVRPEAEISLEINPGDG